MKSVSFKHHLNTSDRHIVYVIYILDISCTDQLSVKYGFKINALIRRNLILRKRRESVSRN